MVRQTLPFKVLFDAPEYPAIDNVFHFIIFMLFCQYITHYTLTFVQFFAIFTLMETSTRAEQPALQPEQGTNVSPERATEDVLSLESISELRREQRRAYYAARFGSERNVDLSAGSREDAEKEAQAVTDAYLAAHFEQDDDAARAAAARELLNKYSYVALRDEDWYIAPDNSEFAGLNQKSGMDRFAIERDEVFGVPAPSPEATSSETETETETAAEQAERYPELEALRDELSTLTAKRQGRVAGKGGEVYAATHDAYMDQVIAAGKIENEAVLNDETLTDEQKNAAVISYLFEEQRKLREQTTEKLKGTKVGKFVEWMNRGGRTKRFFKGVAVGAGVGITAAGIGALAGVAGAAAVGAGVAAVGTGVWRFARGFARADARGGRGMADAPDLADHALDTHVPAEVQERDAMAELFGIPAVDPELEPETPAKIDHMEVMTYRFADVFERDTQAEQNKRRKAVIWGLGGIAAGAALGGALHYVADLAIPDVDATSHVQGGDHQPSTDTGSGDTDTTPDTSNETGGDGGATVEAPVAPEPEMDADYGIQYGEGGIHFFQRLGLTEADWYQTQNDLLAKFPQDFYDPDGTAGPVAVRIAHPGQLSLSAQQYIKERFNLS